MRSAALCSVLLVAVAACSRAERAPRDAARDAAIDASARDAAIDAGRPPPPRVFDAAVDATASEPIAVRCTASGVDEVDGLELLASDGLLEAFTVRPEDDAVFVTVGADLGGGRLHRVEDGALERFGDGIDEVDALHVAGDELFVAISRDDDPSAPLVIAKLDASTGAREDIASDASLGPARAVTAAGAYVYWAADTAKASGGRVYRAPRDGGPSELLSELPTMFLPDGARVAEASLRVSGEQLAYIARAGDFTTVFRAPSDRMADPSPLYSLPAVDGLPAGLPMDVGVEMDDGATYVAFAHNNAWTGQQGITRIPHGSTRGTALFDTGAQAILELTSDARSLYWMMRNRRGTTSLFRGSKRGAAPAELATGLSGSSWTRGLAVSDRYVYFMLADCPTGDGKSLVRIPKR